MTIAVSACVISSSTTTVSVRIVTEKWIIENVLHMLLGIETEMFTIHRPSFVITVNSDTISTSQCVHMTRIAVRNVLKWFASLGTKFSKLRNFKSHQIESSLTYVESFSSENSIVEQDLTKFVEIELKNLNGKNFFYSLIEIWLL
jgi:hypothetical protein